MNGSRRRNIPVVTVILVAANVIYFFILAATGALSNTMVLANRGAMLIIQGQYVGGTREMLISMFVHFGIEHLGSNMIVLAVVGDMLEKRMGSVPLIAVYLICGLVGNLVTIFWYGFTGATTITAGASGAIYGLIGVMVAMVLTRRNTVRGFGLPRILIMIFLMLYSGLRNRGTNLAAHIGGLVAGIICGLVFCIFEGLFRKRNE